MQRKYINDLLAKHNMSDEAGYHSSPIVTKTHTQWWYSSYWCLTISFYRWQSLIPRFYTARYILCGQPPLSIYAQTNIRPLGSRQTCTLLPCWNTNTWHPASQVFSPNTSRIFWCRLGWRHGRLCIHKWLINLSTLVGTPYQAVANTASEVRWLCSLLTELKIDLSSAPVIYCDNVGGYVPLWQSRLSFGHETYCS